MKYLNTCIYYYLPVLGEDCTLNADCHATLCADHHEPICEHPEDEGVVENGGLCTCATADGKLNYQQGHVLSPLRSLAHITDIIITHAFGNKMTHSR